MTILSDDDVNDVSQRFLEMTENIHIIINRELENNGTGLQGYYNDIYQDKVNLDETREALNDELIMEDDPIKIAEIERKIAEIIRITQKTEFIFTKLKNAAGSIHVNIDGGRPRKRKQRRGTKRTSNRCTCKKVKRVKSVKSVKSVKRVKSVKK